VMIKHAQPIKSAHLRSEMRRLPATALAPRRVDLPIAASVLGF
jgi:hypothetical protein